MLSCLRVASILYMYQIQYRYKNMDSSVYPSKLLVHVQVAMEHTIPLVPGGAG